MLKKLLLLALSLSLFGCAAAPVSDSDQDAAAQSSTEATEKDPEKLLSGAYDSLSNYRPEEARKAIDEAIALYQERGDRIGLATAYVVSADYYRFVSNDRYKTSLDKSKKGDEKVEPTYLYMVLGKPASDDITKEAKKAEDIYQGIVKEALAKKDHYEASMNYFRLAVLHMRSNKPKEACDALKKTLDEHIAGLKTEPNREWEWDKMRYPSFADQIVDYRKKTKCE